MIFSNRYVRKYDIHIPMMKNWVSHILFLRKRGPIVYMAAKKKGAIRLAHPYFVTYKGVPPAPPPPREFNSPVARMFIECTS